MRTFQRLWQIHSNRWQVQRKATEEHSNLSSRDPDFPQLTHATSEKKGDLTWSIATSSGPGRTRRIATASVTRNARRCPPIPRAPSNSQTQTWGRLQEEGWYFPPGTTFVRSTAASGG